MSFEILTLMVEDLHEVCMYKQKELYSVHPMDDLEEYKEDVENRYWNKETLEYSYLYTRKDFDESHEWFYRLENTLISLDEKELKLKLLKDQSKIYEIYIANEIEYKNLFTNGVEIRTEFLKKAIIEEDLEEEDSIVYQDVDLSSIAEMLSLVSIRDLRRQLFFQASPTWHIVEKDDMNYLVEI